MKKIILVLSCAFISLSVKAQILTVPQEQKKMFDNIDQLFESNKDDMNMHFQTRLNEDVSLLFEYNAVSLWKGAEEFRKPLEAAARQIKLYADSLKPFANSRRLDIYESNNGKLISRFQSSAENNNLRINQNEKLEALKMGKDTLRIVKTLAIKEFRVQSVPERFQYTFVMKDLNDFSKILDDEKWINQTVHILDSVMAVYKKKWRNPDADFHSLYIKQNAKDTLNPIFICKRPVEGFNKMSGVLTINGGFGVSLVRNTLCPNAEIGLQFHFKGEEDFVPFVRLSMNSFTRFEEQADKKFKAYSTGFVNAELGFQTNELNKYNRNALLSIGFGYKLTTKEQFFRDPSMDKTMYKMFFNYGLSNSIILQPEFITNFKKYENQNGWIGMTINFRLF